METLLILGLGNPGPGYARTRHNVGFRCVDRYAEDKGIRFGRIACQARVAVLEQRDGRIVLAKPLTFMNLSGMSARSLVHSLRITPERLFVVHDDVDLPLGRLRIRASGGPGGHNGVRSIIECLGTEGFPRVRVGIGRPEMGIGSGGLNDLLTDHVLAPFSSAEETVIVGSIARVSEILDCIVAEGVDAAMNRFNGVV